MRSPKGVIHRPSFNCSRLKSFEIKAIVVKMAAFPDEVGVGGSNGSPPRLVEATESYLHIEWPQVVDVIFELEMKEVAALTVPTSDTEWKSLTTTLKSNSVKKKNLLLGVGYQFRYRIVGGNGHFSHPSDTYYLRDPTTMKRYITPPSLVKVDGNCCTISYTEVDGVVGYKIRYRREDCYDDWVTIEKVVSGSSVTKKNLINGATYLFSVVPVTENSNEYVWSMATSIKVHSLVSYFSQILPSELYHSSSSLNMIKSREFLPNKIILLYFSAHWCGPCRQWTPQLAQFYVNIKRAQLSHEIEIIFCSCDHSNEEFLSYYKESHPWLAVHYDAPAREELASRFKVTGIPRCVVLNPSGKIIVDNLVGTNLDVSLVNSWKAM